MAMMAAHLCEQTETRSAVHVNGYIVHYVNCISIKLSREKKKKKKNVLYASRKIKSLINRIASRNSKMSYLTHTQKHRHKY